MSQFLFNVSDLKSQQVFILILKVINGINFMRNSGSTRILCQINSQPQTFDSFYDPLTPTQLLKKKKPLPSKSTSHRTLFSNDNNPKQEDDFFSSYINQIDENEEPFPEETAVLNIDKNLKNIFQKSKRSCRHITIPKNQPIWKSLSFIENNNEKKYQPFAFEKKIRVKYPQTPYFKNQLLSPFWKFNKDNKYNIDTLQKNCSKSIKGQYPALQLDEDPIKHVSDPLRYFIGIAMKLKAQKKTKECMAFLKLACYVQPYNEKAWKKYLQMLETRGQIRKCFQVAKTAFLFCPNEQFAKTYVLNGQRCDIEVNQLQGIITNVNNPQIFEKTVLVEIAKLYIKNKQTWKGIKILYEICLWNQFRLPVCGIVHYLARLLDNLGYVDKALSILKKSFGKSMSKLQIYTLYLEIKNRQQNGLMKQNSLKDVLNYVEYISGQNRYKLYLQIAQILYYQNHSDYKQYLEQAYFAARNFCAPGTGCNKALRHIFFLVLRWKKICYPIDVINDMTAFEKNRQDFIMKNFIQEYQFADWKYYLHYGLVNRQDILGEACRRWPYTGRLIAEWIHCLRKKLSLIQIHSLWSQKIKQVPKSGQLWCQGGRIFIELKDYENASKCFRYAMHFTPQYGDSFFEELKVLLIQGKLTEAAVLKNKFFASQPFYGHLLSYIKNCTNSYKLSLREIWELGTNEIQKDLYHDRSQSKPLNKNKRSTNLTCLKCYNEAKQNPISQQIRIQLLSSYDQFDNKN